LNWIKSKFQKDPSEIRRASKRYTE
jgi:hypothetical protein